MSGKADEYEKVFIIHFGSGDASWHDAHDGDGIVNNRDAARLLQYLAGWDVEVVEAALDANGDGEVNNKDITRLFQYLSDYDVEVTEEALDINGEGSINNKDLTRLFQYLSDYEVELH